LSSTPSSIFLFHVVSRRARAYVAAYTRLASYGHARAFADACGRLRVAFAFAFAFASEEGGSCRFARRRESRSIGGPRLSMCLFRVASI